MKEKTFELRVEQTEIVATNGHVSDKSDNHVQNVSQIWNFFYLLSKFHFYYNVDGTASSNVSLEVIFHIISKTKVI